MRLHLPAADDANILQFQIKKSSKCRMKNILSRIQNAVRAILFLQKRYPQFVKSQPQALSDDLHLYYLLWLNIYIFEYFFDRNQQSSDQQHNAVGIWVGGCRVQSTRNLNSADTAISYYTPNA